MRSHTQTPISNIHDIFPLAPFLIALNTIGIRPTPRDYERINRVLHTGDRWDMERLRFTLSALLVRSPNQEADFGRRFDDFFRESQTVVDSGTIDLERALDELRSLEKQNVVHEKLLPKRGFSRKKGVTGWPTGSQPSFALSHQDDDKLVPPSATAEDQYPELDDEAPSASTNTPEPPPQPSGPPVEDFSRYPFGFEVCNSEMIGEKFELPDAEAPIWNENRNFSKTPGSPTTRPGNLRAGG